MYQSQQNKEPAPCEECGSDKRIEVEALMYCRDCGMPLAGYSQQYDQSTPAMIRSGAKVRIKARRVEKPPRQPEKAKPDNAMRERARVGDDYPFYLGNVGQRIGTFAKLLVKISSILVEVYGVPDECKAYTLKLAQQYLRKFGCAFCAKEVGKLTKDKLYNPSFIKTVDEMKRLKYEAEEEAERKREERRLKESQEYTVLAVIMQDTEYAKMPPIVPEPVDPITDVTTELRVEAMNLAGVVYLEIDAIIAITYLAAQLSGCRWIQISDMYRWYREGRFGVTKDQHLALYAASTWDSRDALKRIRRRGMLHFDGIEPLSAVMRVFAYLTQFVGIPTTLSIMSFDTVCLRTIYNMGLPNMVVDRVRQLAKLLPPANTDHGADSFVHLAPVDKDFKEKLFDDYATCGPHGYFNKVFNDRPTEGKRWEIIPLEVKAAALTLFALKAVFGLDGCREFELKPDYVSDSDTDQSDAGMDSSDVFIFKDWLLQLKLRLKAWQGQPIEDVLCHRFSEPDLDENANIIDENADISDENAEVVEEKIIRRPKFQCVPDYVRLMKNGRLVDTDEDRSPVKDVLGKSKDELFAPLRYQATKHIDQGLSTDRNADEEGVEAFFKCFTKSLLNYEPMETELPRTSEAIVVIDLEEKNKKCFHTLLFPCANEYERIVPVEGLMVMSHHHATLRGLDGVCPTLERSVIDALYASYQPHFSTTFAELLRIFSIIIGEREEMLLFAFAMVEAMLVDDVADMERDLRTGKWLRFPITDTKTFMASIRLIDMKCMAQHFRFEVAKNEKKLGKKVRSEKYELVDEAKRKYVAKGGKTGKSDDFKLAYGYALNFISFKYW